MISVALHAGWGEMSNVKLVRLIGGKVDPEYPSRRIKKSLIKNGRVWRGVCMSAYSSYDDVEYFDNQNDACTWARHMQEGLEQDAPWEDFTWD